LSKPVAGDILAAGFCFYLFKSEGPMKTIRKISSNAMRIAICLCFRTKAEEAAKYYVSIFKNSKITNTSYYGEAVAKGAGVRKGSVLAVTFELNGQEFMALNGPDFKYTEAMSIMLPCKDQKELDYYWKRLSAGGNKSAQMCGWLKDKYGVSWQVFPAMMTEILKDKSIEKTDRVLAALSQMKKLDIKTLKKAYKDWLK
jgi:predicted 3-demethylubiquinone-9 3-methyltransferase (glyoxalase superfamily)